MTVMASLLALSALLCPQPWLRAYPRGCPFKEERPARSVMLCRPTATADDDGADD
jgi:hypothetical protein